MSAQISTLQNSLNASSLSEAELKALDRFHRSQRFKRSSEQTRLLKNRKEVSRSQEKDDFDGDGSSQSAQDVPDQHNASPSKNNNSGKVENIVHKIIAYFRSKMTEVWEKEIRKADYWMMDETPGMVGCIKEGTKSYLNRYFSGESGQRP